MSWIHLQKSDKLVLGCLVVAGILAMIFLSLTGSEPTKGGGWLSAPSSFHNDQTGVKALYLTLQKSGHRVSRFRRMMDDLNLQRIQSLVLMQGDLRTTPLQATERDSLLQWVHAGGALLLSPGRSDFKEWFTFRYIDKPPIPLPEDPKDPDSILKEIDRQTDPQNPDQTPPDAKKAVDQLVETLKNAHKPTRLARAGAELQSAHPIAAGLGSLATRPTVRLDPTTPLAGPLKNAPHTVFWSDADGLAGIVIQHGRGRILFLGDSYPLSNIGLSQEDNALLAANLAADLAGDMNGEIAFDEFHLGYPHRDISGVAIVRLALGGPWGWAIGQLLVVGALWMLADMVRFGRAWPPRLPPRRRHGEFIRAAARLLDITKASGMAWGQIAGHYRPLLCRWANLSADIDDSTLAAEVNRRTGVDILPALQGTPGRDGGGAAKAEPPGTTGTPAKDRLVQWTGLMQRALEKLQHGTDASLSDRRRPSR